MIVRAAIIMSRVTAMFCENSLLCVWAGGGVCEWEGGGIQCVLGSTAVYNVLAFE